ncbi:hypothetical protein FCK90_06405 [Kocuria coralli]|uniref:Uncharacterized protein n=1 Tax=Kocuria coralli TaxID=1461025 RepID=A0A5J5KXQ4_9MICC|nr:hypothetical protein [Kocuria coralli]KAA9394453.1 hypothetical protein FCK90_06405 [Kocuria coralli]
MSGGHTTLGRALRSQAGFAVVLAAVSVIAAFLGQRSVLRNNNFSVIDDGALLGVIALSAAAVLWPWVLADLHREDYGFPRRGLIPLLLLSGPTVAVAAAVSMLAWPWALGSGADFTTLGGSLGENPLGILVLSAGCWFLTNVGITASAPVFAAVDPLWLRLLYLVPFLTSVIAGPVWLSHWQGAPYQQAGSVQALTTMLVLVVLSGIAAALTGVLINWLRSRAQAPLRRLPQG